MWHAACPFRPRLASLPVLALVALALAACPDSSETGPEGGRPPEQDRGGVAIDKDVALLCYRAEAKAPLPPTMVDLRTRIGLLRGIAVEPLRWVCEPGFKAHVEDDVPEKPPRVLPLACYPIDRRRVGLPARLTDHNGYFDEKVIVDESLLLCNPGLELAGVGDLPTNLAPHTGHLVGFSLTAGDIPLTTVFVRDRWGVTEVAFERSFGLLERAVKNELHDQLPPGPPYHCYHVDRARPIEPRSLQLDDQFTSMTVDQGRPEVFCDLATRTLE